MTQSARGAAGRGLTRGGSAAGLAVLAAAAWVSLRLIAPPEPLPVDAPAGSFSAGRAMVHVRSLAASPRPPGAASHEAARDRLLASLAELGLRPQVQRTTVARALSGRRIVAASVANVVARLPGREAGPAVMLMAHYDSRPTTAGAGDDASGVAAVLETVRALRAREVTRRDVIVLLTDGEEGGLFGARAFVDQHAWMADVGVVINLEARGQRGPAIMFETVGGANGPLIRGLVGSGARPVANSLTAEVYKRLPNDTDLTPIGKAGTRGLNVAFIGGFSAYHTALDTIDRLDQGSLQQLGDTALALVLRFAERPIDADPGGSAVYFDLPGGPIVGYPTWLAVPLALLAAALLAVAIVALGRHGRGGLGSVLAGLLRALSAGAILVLVAVATWWLLLRAVPSLTRGPYSVPYDGGWLTIALVLLGAAPASWLLAARRSMAQPLALACGALIPWAVAAVASAVVLPGASFAFTWPLLAAVAGVGLAVLVPPGHRWLSASLTLGALPGLLLLVPIAALLRDALSLRATAAVVTVAGALPMLLVAALLGGLGTGSRGRSTRGPLALFLAGLALLGLLLVRDRPGRDRPSADTLTYRLDAASGEAAWLSFDRRPSRWGSSVLGARPERVPGPFPIRSTATVLRAPAPVLDLASPTVEAIRGETGFLRVRVASPRRAPTFLLSAGPAEGALAGEGIEAVWVGDRRVVLEGDPEERITLRFLGLPVIGTVIGFERRGAVSIEVADQQYGLPTEILPAPLPADRIAKPSWLTDSTLVVARYAFDG